MHKPRCSAAGLVILGIVAVIAAPGCYRKETTRTSAMGGRPLTGDRKFDETPQNRGPSYTPNTKSRVW